MNDTLYLVIIGCTIAILYVLMGILASLRAGLKSLKAVLRELETDEPSTTSASQGSVRAT